MQKQKGKIHEINRNSNFELLRIIAMLMVVIGHLYKFMSESPNFEECELATNMIAPWALTNQGVDIFILISGYFGIRSNIKKYVDLWLTLAYYAIISAIICYFVLGLPLKTVLLWPAKEMLVATSSLWFISTYFALMVFAPFINILFEMKKITQIQYCLLFIIVDVIFQTAQPQFYGLSTWGGALLHFITLYVIGRIISTWKISMGVMPPLLIYLIVSFLGFIAWDKPFYSGKDTSLWIIIPSICILFVFRSIPPFYNKIVNSIAKASLGVYCFHARSALLVTSITTPILIKSISSYGNYTTLSVALIISLIIYAVTIPFDFLLRSLKNKVNPYILRIIGKFKNLLNQFIPLISRS